MSTPLQLDNVPADEWIKALPGNNASLVQELLASGKTEEEVATLWLSRTGADHTAGFGAGGAAQNYFANVQAEFKKFVCGDAEYEDLRKKINEIWKKQKSPALYLIASAVALKTGISGVVLLPVIALLLAIVGRVGVNAWCNMPPPPAPSPT